MKNTFRVTRMLYALVALLQEKLTFDLPPSFLRFSWGLLHSSPHGKKSQPCSYDHFYWADGDLHDKGDHVSGRQSSFLVELQIWLHKCNLI